MEHLQNVNKEQLMCTTYAVRKLTMRFAWLKWPQHVTLSQPCYSDARLPVKQSGVQQSPCPVALVISGGTVSCKPLLNYLKFGPLNLSP